MAGTCKVKLTTNIPALKAAAEREAQAAIEATTQGVISHARISMAEPKSGRVYLRGKNKTIEHRASAPGEAPAVDTGFLINSWWVWRPRPLTRIIDVGAEYAPALEYGTPWMAARPFLGPALQAMRGFFRARLADIIRRGAR